jgi:hypothetical protein
MSCHFFFAASSFYDKYRETLEGPSWAAREENLSRKPEIPEGMNRFLRVNELRSLSWLARTAACLLMLSACNPQVVKPPPVTWPSLVITRDGMAYNVQGLRIPSTIQEFRLKLGGTTMWVPFYQVDKIWFSGLVRDSYRTAVIILSGGEKIQGEVFVDFLIEGMTDLGYWNMSMTKVERLEMGSN